MKSLRLLCLLLLWPVAALGQVPAPTPQEREVAFGAINQAMLGKQMPKAADLLVMLIAEPSQSVFHAEAHARLGKVFSNLDLPYSALLAYEKALRLDPQAVGGEASLALDLGEKVGDAAILEPIFASNMGLATDDLSRSRMAYLAARENQRKGNHAVAQGMLQMVQNDHPNYPEAQALKGVVLSLQKQYVDAIGPLQIALASGKARGRDAQFVNTVQMNIARAYYSAKNFPQAAEHWSQIPREDPIWLQAQFERAWAHFQMKDMSGTLALLQNHESPYFRDLYYPEASLLRIYSLFLLCKFPDAVKQIDDFQARYKAQHSAMMVVAARPPAELVKAMRDHVETGKSDLPPSLIALYAKEQRFLDSLKAIKAAEQELERLRGVNANPFSAYAAQWVDARRAQIEKSEGERIAKKARSMEANLEELLRNSDMSKLDMLQMEQRLLERASVMGEMPEAKRRVKRKLRGRVNQRIWPWQGEFWADELGYYRIDSKPDCPEGMQTGGPGN